MRVRAVLCDLLPSSPGPYVIHIYEWCSHRYYTYNECTKYVWFMMGVALTARLYCRYIQYEVAKRLIYLQKSGGLSEEDLPYEHEHCTISPRPPTL